jgi:hypothetical protein
MICVEETPWMLAGTREELVSESEAANRKFAEVVAKAEAEAERRGATSLSDVRPPLF